MEYIDEYRLIRRLAKGGMGEVYQAYDTKCQRYVALKKIRGDLKNYQGIRSRFLKEAHLAASLTHPSIVPIFKISDQGSESYYSMPLLAGTTLKKLVLEAREDPSTLTISRGVSIFLSLSHAVAHAHQRGVVHRDIKAENILIDGYDEVAIIDWGVAKAISQTSDPLDQGLEDKDSIEDSKETLSSEFIETLPQMTKPGKVVGTLSYLAPERVLKKAFSFRSDIYSLGVLFYYLLSLHLPFRRKSIKEFSKNSQQERFIDPRRRAPFREIPDALVRILEKCLRYDPDERYQRVEELIEDLHIYTEKRSNWVSRAILNPSFDEDWRKKEWTFLTSPMIRSDEDDSDTLGWVTRMTSCESFEGNLKVCLEVSSKENTHGMGVLLSVPEEDSEHKPLEGYCLWLGGPKRKGGTLLKDGVLVLDLPEFTLSEDETHKIIIEKIDNALYLYFDKLPKVTYVSYLPKAGTHVGLAVAKGHYNHCIMEVFGGHLSLQVNCLKLPDTLLSLHLYIQALAEYRRIGATFADYAEGRQAIFRAGITLLEWAKASGKSEYLEDALEEFEKLKNTLSAPLEWLGKSLVYRFMGEVSDEANCLELACMRYRDHPLKHWLEEEVIFRIHESLNTHPVLACRLMLLLTRALPKFFMRRDVQSLTKLLLNSLPKLWFWESSTLIKEDGRLVSFEEIPLEGIGVKMAYHTDSPASIIGIVDLSSSLTESDLKRYQNMVINAFFALLDMEEVDRAKEILDKTKDKVGEDLENLMRQTLALETESEVWCSTRSCPRYYKKVEYFLRRCLRKSDYECGLSFARKMLRSDPLDQIPKELFSLSLSLALWARNGEAFDEIWGKAQAEWSQKLDLCAYFLGCRKLIEGKMEEAEACFIEGFKELNSFELLAIFDNYIHERLIHLKHWAQKALTYEKKKLFQYLMLYYFCAYSSEISNQKGEILQRELGLEEGFILEAPEDRPSH